jgi:hypothetical protein
VVELRDKPVAEIGEAYLYPQIAVINYHQHLLLLVEIPAGDRVEESEWGKVCCLSFENRSEQE